MSDLKTHEIIIGYNCNEKCMYDNKNPWNVNTMIRICDEGKSIYEIQEKNKETFLNTPGKYFIPTGKSSTKIANMQKDIDKLKEKVGELQARAAFDNIICDHITYVYDVIIQHYNKKFQPIYHSWRILNQDVKKEKQIEERVNKIRRSPPFNINDKEWKIIGEFKKERNSHTHGDLNAIEARQIIDVLQVNEEVKLALKRIVSLTDTI